MGNPNEELRAKLDECGVEYRIDDAKTVRVTEWEFGEHSSATFTEYDDGECVFVASGYAWTTEQAIAATVGVGSNTVEAIRKLLDKLNTELCNAGCVVECETREERQRLIDAVKDEYAQAIASTAGAGTCNIEKTHGKSPIDGKEIVTYKCSECGTLIGADSRYCNQCGARVVSE